MKELKERMMKVWTAFRYSDYAPAACIVAVAVLFVVGPRLMTASSASIASQVVRLTMPSNHRHGGTGFAVKAPSGRIYTLTNAHVCRVAEGGTMDAIGANEERSSAIRIVEISKETDLCILEPLPSQFSGIELGASVEAGDSVAITGHPLLEDLTTTRGEVTSFLTINVTLGELSDEACQAAGGRNVLDDSGFFRSQQCIHPYFAGRSTALIFPGNSGSPVVNTSGRLVGVAFAANDITHFGYFIPLKDVKRFLEAY